MLLKRSLILAAGVLLFIVAFITYFQISHMRMEDRFRAEREKFNIHQGDILTASTPVAPAPPVPAAPDTNTAASTAGSSTPDSAAAAADTNAAAATPDTNSAPATPDTNAAPSAPATPDSNAAPATPAAPASTMEYRHSSRPSVFQLAAYYPSENAQVEFVEAEMGAATALPAAAPAPSPAAVSAAQQQLNALREQPAPASAAAPAKQEGKVIVLLYHQFKAAGVAIPAKFQWTMNVDVFESEMKYIHDNGYHVIPMSDLLKFLHHQISLPSNSVCITIDDGYKSAIVFAAPILKKYGYPWTFFIYPDFITTAEGPGAASWNDLLQLQAEGVDIESHSMTHPNLKLHKQKVKSVWHSFSPDEYAAWLDNETAGSKALLEQKMGKPITCFAYPYGEYNKQVEDAAIAAGYDAIFTVADNPVHPTTDLHSIGRYTITQGVEKNFTAYLHQGALSVADADPAPGATITNPRPVITATLDYAGTIDPKSIETQVRDFGDVRHDYDPQTKMLRLYLPRDLIAPVALVNIRARDAVSGQIMVANWHFNYAPEGNPATAVHVPIAPATTEQTATPSSTNAPEATEPETMEKNAPGTPLDAHPTAPAAPAAPVAKAPAKLPKTD